MASKDPENVCNTGETDEETIALRKKRSRRVSFADREITSVHIFNRDEDYETPPDSASAVREQEMLSLFNEVALNLPDSDDLDGGGDVDAFLRPVESPSPGGSSVLGSATSNDEDNFFGPVSAGFIRPGRLSDSAASDDNHELTMDSTAFSMHFQSLVRSESGDLKTSTMLRLPFEERTPSQVTTPSDTGRIMLLKNAEQLMTQSLISVDKVGGGKDSDDMSLVGKNLHDYDYGKLSPTLEALVAKGTENLDVVPASDSINLVIINKSAVSISDNDGKAHIELQNHLDSELCSTDKNRVSAPAEVDNANDGLTTALMNEMNGDFSSKQNDGPSADVPVARQIQSPSQMNRERHVISNMFNSELSAVSNGSLLNEGTYLDTLKQPETGNLPPARLELGENSNEDGRFDSIVHLVSDQVHLKASPTVGSRSSLAVKDLKILPFTTNSPRTALYVTPSPKPQGSFLSKDSIKQGGSISFVLKSSSKSKILQPSPSVFALSDRIEKIKQRLSGSVSSKDSRLNSIIEQSSNSRRVKHRDVPIANLEQQLYMVNLREEQTISMVSIDKDGIGTPKHIPSTSQGCLTIVDEECRRLIENKIVMSSPTKHVEPAKHPHDRALVGFGNNFQSMEVTLKQVNDKRDTDISDKLVSLPARRMDQNLSSLADGNNSFSGCQGQKDQDDELALIRGQDSSSNQAIPGGNYDTLTVEERAEPSSTLVGADSVIYATHVKRVDNRESIAVGSPHASDTLRKFSSLRSAGFASKLVSERPENNDRNATDTTCSTENFLDEGRTASCIDASPVAYQRSTPEQSRKKRSSKWKPTPSPKVRKSPRGLYRKELHTASESSIGSYQGSWILHDPNSKEDLKVSEKRKKTSEELVLAETDHADRTDRIQRSSKVHRVGQNNIEFIVEDADGSKKGNESNEGGRCVNASDISLKLSSVSSDLLSPFIEKLNMRTIDLLADVLVHQAKVNGCRMLCTEIQSQAYSKLSDVRYTRVTECKSLLGRLMYEKAIRQLMHAKHARLLKCKKLLRTGAIESQVLKLNCDRHVSLHGQKDTPVVAISKGLNFDGQHESANDEGAIMNHEMAALERKIKTLTKSFHDYCKLKGEPSSAETIVLLDEHLKRRSCCRLIRQDIQFWEIDTLLNNNGHHVIVLNYIGLICQRLTLNAGPVSSIFISTKLDDVKITRNFSSMDACTAFKFVFKTDSAKKYVGLKILAQETQRTSLILSNLMDVAEEVQLAQIQIRSLTQASFCSTSADRLDLQLTFTNFNCGGKLRIDLDMTCLGSGVYPTEVVPYRLQALTGRVETFLCEPLLIEIKAAIGGLRGGYLRIMRLCQRISLVLQGSK